LIENSWNFKGVKICKLFGYKGLKKFEKMDFWFWVPTDLIEGELRAKSQLFKFIWVFLKKFIKKTVNTEQQKPFAHLIN